MRYHIYGILIGACIIWFLWMSDSGRAVIDRVTTLDVYATALAKVSSCVNQRGAALCERAAVATMLKEKSGTEVMQSLASLLTPLQCHYVGHVVGQQLYFQHPNIEDALGQCDRSCDSSCIHGVIGTVFAESLGFKDPDNSDFDLEHLSPSEISTIGKKLCVTGASCHGVGHTLFQGYKQLEPAFSMCRQIGAGATATANCYNGAAMEYVDIISSKNVRAVSGVESPDPEKLTSLCALSRPGEARACFRYFPRLVVETLRREGISRDAALQRVQDICASYTSAEYRVSCFSGIGGNRAYALAPCDGFATEFDQKACLLGIVAVATEDRAKQLASYCAAQPTDSLKSVCYQALSFSHFNRSGRKLDVLELCGSDNSLCEESAANYSIDSWEQLKASFDE